MADAEASKSAATSPPKYPPGVVLGPDGKPCKICTDTASWKALNRTFKKKDTNAGSQQPGTSNAKPVSVAAALAASSTAATEPRQPNNCPPDVEQLGRATWTFLHTTAAYYPENPSPAQRSSMLALLSSLPHLYPCSWCASHLGENLKQHPPEKAVTNRGLLSQWLCDRHNDVNRRLGKEIFDCSTVDERWKDGPADGSCD